MSSPLHARLHSRLLISLFCAVAVVPNANCEKARNANSPQENTSSHTSSLDTDFPEHHFTLVPSHYKPHSTRPSNCTQTPCVLPNVQISLGPKPVSETPVTANPANPMQLMAGANDENCGAELQGGVYNSDDGGTTWRLACMNLPQKAQGGGDPGVAYDLLGNAFYTGIVFYQNLNQVFIQKSADNGQTWSEAIVAVPATLGFISDKDWLKVDTNPNSPYANRVYISATQLDFIDDTQTTVSHSSDGGNTWTTVAVDLEQFGGRSEPEELTDFDIAPDGTVYLVWLKCANTELFNGCAGHKVNYLLSKSTDGGDTWTEPQVIFSLSLAPNNNFHCCYWGALPNTSIQVVDVPGLGIDTSNGPHQGTLYISFYEWTGSFMKLYVARSIDQGATWTRTAVAPDRFTHDQFFPWLSVSPQGLVGVSWLDRRNDPNNVNYEAFAAVSTDGGASFSRNVKLSENPSDPANDGFGGRFIGDYTGNTWAGDNTFLATYTDTTTGIDQDFLVGVRLK